MTIALVEPDTRADVLAGWATETRAAAEIAASLALTPFVPDTLRVVDKRTGEINREATTATIAAALLTGREVGLSPMAAMRSIDVIHGTPALRALAARALVLARGHDMWIAESTSTRCIMRGQRRGSQHTQEITWTLDRARALGVVNREQWRRQPTAMLVARATAELARVLAPEALLGLPYVVEELGDNETGSGGGSDDALIATASDDTHPPTPRKRTAKRKARPVVDAPLPADDVAPPQPTPPADEQEPPPPAVLPITEAQIKKLGATMNEAGITDRDEALAYVSSVIGRDVASRNDLTRGEASEIIDALAKVTEEPEHDNPDPWADNPDPGDPWGDE